MSRCILVSGFHRSGTSMTMQALHRAGVHIGDNLIGANPYNVDGHFENTDIVGLHNEALDDLRSDWLTVDFSNDLQNLFTDESRVKAKTITNKLRHPSVWGFKDPRASLFLWDWQSLIPDLFVVVVCRHYLPCIQSLKTRAARSLTLNPSKQNIEARLWLEPSCGLKSWIAYNRRLIEYAKSNKRSTLVVQQESIVKGFALVEAVNTHAQLNLSVHAKTGISASKSSSAIKLPILQDQIPQELIDQAEDIWSQIEQHSHQNLDSAVSTKHSLKPCNSIASAIEVRMSKVNFDDIVKIKPAISHAPITLQPPLHAYTQENIRTYRPRLRASLKNNLVTPASRLISAYELSDKTTYFGEMLLAEKALVDGDYSGAKRVLANAESLEPKDGFEPFLRGSIEEHFGNLNLASDLFKAATKKTPDTVLFWDAYIRTLCNQDEYFKALNAAESALGKMGKNLRLEIKKADILDHLGELTRAIEVLNESLVTWPDNLFLLQSLCELQSKAGNNALSKKAFNKFALLKITQNGQYSKDITQLFSSISSDKDQQHLWHLIDTHLHDFNV